MTTRDALKIANRYDRAIEELEAEAVAQLNAALDAVYRDLERELRASYTQLQSQGGLIAAQRKLLIEDELGELLRLSSPIQGERYEQIYNDLLQSTSVNGSTMADELIAAIDSEWPIAQFARIPIEAVAFQARDGRNRLSRHSDEFADRASAVVEQGLIQGWGPNRVADILRRELGITKGKAQTIARTEVSSAFNQAAEQRYKDNGIEYFQWIVTPNEGLCPYCSARNGKVYKLGKARIPGHPRCLCISLPWSKEWQKAGLTDDEFIEDYRDRNIAALRADGQQPNNGPTYWEKKAGLTQAPRPVWVPGVSLGRQTLNNRLDDAKTFAAEKSKEQGPDMIVNTGGLVGSVVGQSVAGVPGALIGDLVGAAAVRQVVTISQAVLSAKEKLRSQEEANLRSKVDQLRELGRATLSEFNDPDFQRRYMNDLTGDVGGWSIGNTAAIVGNLIPGVANIPMKGALVAMAAVPKVQKARIKIVDRFKQKRKRKDDG